MTFEEEFLAELKIPIEAGNILVESSSQDFCEVISSSFPFAGSAIDWEKIPNSVSIDTDEDETELETWFKFYNRICLENNIKGNCIWVSESTIDCALVTSIETFNEYFKVILSYPFDHYIFNKTLAWCFVFRTGKDMSFGFMPKAK